MGRPPTEPGPEAQRQGNASADTPFPSPSAPTRSYRPRPPRSADPSRLRRPLCREPNPNANRKLREIAGDVAGGSPRDNDVCRWPRRRPSTARLSYMDLWIDYFSLGRFDVAA